MRATPTPPNQPARSARPGPTRAGPARARTDLSKVARGRWGEDRAAAHYRGLGYRLIDRNWRSSTGEIDLVVERNGLIVFSEVKARRSDRYGPAAAAVSVTKQRRIRRLAMEWLDFHAVPRNDIRFDVVAITGTRLELIESAF